jgi:hypothetical protein
MCVCVGEEEEGSFPTLGANGIMEKDSVTVGHSSTSASLCDD